MSVTVHPMPAPGPAPARHRVARVRTHLLAPAAIATGIALWDPARHGGPPLCPFHALTGHSCPGCGITRAVGALLRGRGHEALTLHPLAPLVVAEVLVACLAYVVLGDRLRQVVPARTGPVVLLVTAVAFVAVWVARSATGQISVLG